MLSKHVPIGTYRNNTISVYYYNTSKAIANASKIMDAQCARTGRNQTMLAIVHYNGLGPVYRRE
ncbi:MAG: hypothetical protein ACKESA_00675, partial [Candidatus Hodgkinia cicadicola]